MVFLESTAAGSPSLSGLHHSGMPLVHEPAAKWKQDGDENCSESTHEILQSNMSGETKPESLASSSLTTLAASHDRVLAAAAGTPVRITNQ